MSALQAARFGDQIGHTSAMSGLLTGLVVGFIATAVVLVAVGATVATGGAAAVVIGGLIAGTAGGGLAGMNIGATFDSEPKGPINSGSENTFLGTGQMKAARAKIDTVACLNHAIKRIAQGSTDVFINNFPAARRTDATVCSAKIRDGQPDVFFGGPTGTYVEMESEVPGWLVTTLKWAAIVGTVVATGGAILTVGFGAAMLGLGASYVGGELGGKLGGAIGEHLGGESGKAIGEALGEFAGSTLGGHIADKISAPPKGPVASPDGPVALRETPVAARETPVAARETPVAAREAPVAPREAPVAAREAPVAPKEAPVAPKEAPVAPKEAPVAPKEAPVAAKEAPVAAKEAPVAAKEAPVAAKEAPVVPKETPVAPKEAPVAPKEGVEPTVDLATPKDAPPVRPDTSQVKYGPDSKYKKPDGTWDWPPDGGFSGPRTQETLPVDTRIDRFGHEGGDYLSPEGTPFEQRALAPKSLKDDYHVYKVVKPLPVESGGIAPAFDQPGGGVQYKTTKSVKQLLDEGYIVEIDP